MSLPERIMDSLLKVKRFQDWVNCRFELCGYKWQVSPNRSTIAQVLTEYRFYDLRKTDIVLDIGACCGGFSLFAARQARRVYAVEPVCIDELNRNIFANNIQNIITIDECLGNGPTEVNWLGSSKVLLGTALSEIIKMCGVHVDFLKCDCEGGEWCIKPEELQGIRRLEMEIHSFPGMPKVEEFKKVLDKANFEYEFEKVNDSMALVHATKKEN